jgi:hypothetical protein
MLPTLRQRLNQPTQRVQFLLAFPSFVDSRHSYPSIYEKSTKLVYNGHTAAQKPCVGYSEHQSTYRTYQHTRQLAYHISTTCLPSPHTDHSSSSFCPAQSTPPTSSYHSASIAVHLCFSAKNRRFAACPTHCCFGLELKHPRRNKTRRCHKLCRPRLRR